MLEKSNAVMFLAKRRFFLQGSEAPGKRDKKIKI